MNRVTRYAHVGVSLATIALGGGSGLRLLPAAELKMDPSGFFRPAVSSRDDFDDARPTVRRGKEEERTVHLIYFPPNPPPLGVELGLQDVDARLGGPAELAPYVMEPFYAPLSTRLIERTLTSKQEAKLARFDDERARLLQELRVRLAELAEVGGTTRWRALEELAVRQTPALVDLERTADDLRKEFFRSPGSAAGGNWYYWRGWKLGRGALDRPREQTLFFEGQLLRGAAFYQPGLLPAQRRLLRECAIELEAVVFPGVLSEAPSAAEWFWYFSPHLARIHLPEDLPRAVAEAITAFRDEKSALKAELREAVFDADREKFDSAREKALAGVARAQASRLEALEGQAEAIRRQLVMVAQLAPSPVSPPPLPAEITVMIEAFAREKKNLERLLAQRVRAALRAIVTPEPYAMNSQIVERHEDRLKVIDEAHDHFRVVEADRLAALAARLREIRTAVEAWGGPGATGAPHSDNATFLRDFLAQRGEQQGRHEMHLAVFEPGLAPEQRRLLLGAAMVALNLPLPGPEEQPTTVPATLLK